jgi:hypothetical protein
MLTCCNPDRKTPQGNVILSGTGERSLIELEFSYESSPALPFDSLMDDVFYVKLETTGNNLIGEISQILFAKDRIIVVDKDVSKSITVYDMSGKFLNTIGCLGQGPQEYTYLAHVALSADSSMVVVDDMGTKSLKFYTIDGKFVKSKSISFYFDTFEFYSDELTVINCFFGNIVNKVDPSYKPRMIVTDLSDNISYSAFQCFYNDKYTKSSHFPVRKYGEKVFYNPSFTDTVYLVANEGLYPVYHLKYKGVPPLKIDENITDEIVDDHDKRYPHCHGDFVELQDALYITYSESIMYWARFFLYSKAQNQVYTCTGHLHNPFFFIWTWIKTRYKDNYLVADIQPIRILGDKDKMLRLEANLPPEKRKSLQLLFQDLTEDDNPVLFFYHVNIRNKLTE